MDKKKSCKDWILENISQYRDKKELITDCAHECEVKEKSVKKVLYALKHESYSQVNRFFTKVEPQLLTPVEKRQSLDVLSNYMVELAREDPDRLRHVTKKTFLKKAKVSEYQLPFTYTEIKNEAIKKLSTRGFDYPDFAKLTPGTYLIVGDSHGKHCRSGMIRMIKNVCKHLDIKTIIHVGHALDDDNDISYHWQDFDNFVILGKTEELATLSQKEFKWRVVRNEIYAGDWVIKNQDYIQDYRRTPISNFPIELSKENTIINMHRQESFSRTCAWGTNQIFSPGCICEDHIKKTVKQIDWASGRQTKVSYPTGYIKYRRDAEFSVFWEQGMLILHVNDDEMVDPVLTRIYQTSKGYACSYFDKIITEREVIEPEQKIFFSGDHHIPMVARDILDIQEQVVEEYQPDHYVDVGDVGDNISLSHHRKRHSKSNIVLDRDNEVCIDFLDEAAYVNYVLQKKSKWAPNRYILLGNHERFYEDFVLENPQFRNMLNPYFASAIEGTGFKVTDLKTPLTIGPAVFVHGDMKLYNAKGTGLLDKIAHTFGRGTIFGHIHYPSQRFGCYSCPLTGEMDLEYNEVDASNWIQGFGLVNIFEGIPFVSLHSIIHKRLNLNKTEYRPVNPESWVLPGYEAKIDFSFGTN